MASYGPSRILLASDCGLCPHSASAFEERLQQRDLASARGLDLRRVPEAGEPHQPRVWESLGGGLSRLLV